MSDDNELKSKLWAALKDHPLVMVGLVNEAGRSRPMTAQFQEGSHSWWFFTTKDGEFFERFTQDHGAVATYCAKDHRMFASIAGQLTLDTNRERVDQLWNRYEAAWFDGKDDPKLALLRFEAASAEIWLNETSLLSGVKLLLGADPKRELANDVARVAM